MRGRRAWLLVAAAALLAGRAQADRVHVVQPGETLWQIAGAVAGDPLAWPALYRANRDQIKDPARLYPGQRLTIPDPEDLLRVAPSAPPVSAEGPGGSDPGDPD